MCCVKQYNVVLFEFRVFIFNFHTPYLHFPAFPRKLASSLESDGKNPSCEFPLRTTTLRGRLGQEGTIGPNSSCVGQLTGSPPNGGQSRDPQVDSSGPWMGEKLVCMNVRVTRSEKGQNLWVCTKPKWQKEGADASCLWKLVSLTGGQNEGL